jgi:sec-independent protein translocase protein TatA
MPNIGMPELMIVLILALIVLGPRKLPEAGRGIGRGMREFKDALTGSDEADPVALETGPAPASIDAGRRS